MNGILKKKLSRRLYIYTQDTEYIRTKREKKVLWRAAHARDIVVVGISGSQYPRIAGGSAAARLLPPIDSLVKAKRCIGGWWSHLLFLCGILFSAYIQYRTSGCLLFWIVERACVCVCSPKAIVFRCIFRENISFSALFSRREASLVCIILKKEKRVLAFVRVSP